MIDRKAGEPFQPSMLREGILIPQALLKDPTLSASARLLWGMLADYQGTSLECFPLEEMLAGFLGVQVRQLQSYLKELANYTRGDPPEAFPLLAIKRVWAVKDQKTRNCYSLVWQPFLGVDLKEAGTERTHLADAGKAQSLAHRSGTNTQNMQLVPPEIPTEEAGMPLRDRQSSAGRSVNDQQDPAAGWPAVPSEDGGGVADGLPPGDTQYSAHQSGGDPQDTAPERCGIPRDGDGTIADGRPPGNPQNTAAEGSTIPSDNDGTVADGRPPGDTQSFAHRSQGDRPDPGRPAILGGDAGTVLDAMQPSDGGAHVVSTQNHGLRLPQTLNPVLPRYAERPLGPGDCKRHSFPGKCKKCGAAVTETHLMLRLMSGAFCERCCPACHPGT